MQNAVFYKYGDIIDITSSSMNIPISKPIAFLWDFLGKESDDLLQEDMYSQENYGVIRFEQDQISVFLKDIDGKEILSVKI